VGHLRIIALAALAVTLTACSPGMDDSEPSPEDFLAEEPYLEPPPVTLAPTPSQEGIPVAGCPSGGDVQDALTDAGTLERGAGMSVGPPTCAGDWTAATVTAGDADPLQVVLRTREGRMYVVVAGSGVCDDPEVAGAPARVLAAAGCPETLN
jgi:hypothetical protein